MGSEILEALIVQKGEITTNPNGLVPDPSRPIQQLAVPVQNNAATSKPIQQFKELTTAPDADLAGGGEKYSKPIEQKGILLHADTTDPSFDHLLELKSVVSPAHPDLMLDVEGPIEQVIFVTANSREDNAPVSKLIEQKLIKTQGSNRSRPIEQVDNVTNIVTITQFDFINLVFPPCNSIKNPTNTNILWRIRDFGFPFDVGSLIFQVDGVEVQDSSDFTITPIANGLQLFYNPPEDFPFEYEVQVFVQIQDTAVPPNLFQVTCLWETVPDTRPPVFLNIEPECNSTAVSSEAPIEFDVVDFGFGVDPDSIILSIEGVNVCSGITLEAITASDSTTLSGIPTGAVGTGYHVTYTHPQEPFRYGSTVTIAMQASDLAPTPNSSLFVCCFGVEDSEAPVFMNVVPEPCDSFVDNRTGLSFEVYGVEHGIDISTLEVRVDADLKKVIVRPKVLRTV